MTIDELNPHGWPVEPLSVSHEGYAEIQQIIVKAGYGNEALAAANMMRRFGLKPFTMYELKVTA